MNRPASGGAAGIHELISKLRIPDNEPGRNDTRMITKTDSGLVEWCHVRLGDGYVYATYFSRIITEAIIQAKALQYPKVYTPEYIQLSRRWIGDDAGDCVGLIKGYYWQDPATGKVIYKLDGRPDVSANGMYTAGRTAGGKSSDQNFNKTWGYIRTIPEHPGVLVWFSGHIGVYVGNGRGHRIKRREIRCGQDQGWQTGLGQIGYSAHTSHTEVIA